MWHENETDSRHATVEWVAPNGIETGGGGILRETAHEESRKETAESVARDQPDYIADRTCLFYGYKPAPAAWKMTLVCLGCLSFHFVLNISLFTLFSFHIVSFYFILKGLSHLVREKHDTFFICILQRVGFVCLFVRLVICFIIT